MNEQARVHPVSFFERLAMTALVPVFMLMAERVPLPSVDEGASNGGVHLSLLSVGLMPFVTAYGLVELAALVVPRWRRWRHEARGRVRLERWSIALAIVLAIVEGWSATQSVTLQGILDRDILGITTVPSWGSVVVQTATLAGGACAFALVAQWSTRRGLVNGYVLSAFVAILLESVRGGAFLRGAALLGGAPAVVLMLLPALIVVAATVIAVRAGDATSFAAGGDDSPFRGGSAKAPYPCFPVPVSSIEPFFVAASLLMLPATLAHFGVPGMTGLVALVQRGDTVFFLVYATLTVLLGFVAAELLHRPNEVAALLRRLGSVSDEAARAEATSALRRALLPTLAYLLTLLVASQTSRGQVSATLTAIATAVGVDLVRSAVVHFKTSDLVCVTRLHDAYAVPALRAALLREGIDATPRGMAVLSLLQAFAAYAPAELYVRAGDAERATSLLRHWAAGEAKPMTAPAPVLAGDSIPWSPSKLAVVLAGLGVLAFVVGLMPRPRFDAPVTRRAQIAVVRVDDDADPLRDLTEDSAPEGTAVYFEFVQLGKDALGKNHTERRSYARVALRDGETPQQAWARVLPWLEQQPLPVGDRWAWEAVSEPDDAPQEEGSGPTFHVVGVRTVVLAGEPVITTADVEDADVRLDEEGGGPPCVSITLTPEAAERFFHVTEAWVGRRLAIVVDDHVDSAPVIRSPIRGGHMQISMGSGSPDKLLDEAKRLAASLR